MMIRAGVGACAVLLASTTAARAQSNSDLPDLNGVGVSITVENDLFVPGDNTDRYYTQGMKLSVLTGDRGGGFLSRALISLLPEPAQGDDWQLRTTVGLGQHMYTPEVKSTVIPDPDDRPYAGWLYASYGGLAFSDTQVAGLELQVGMVGPDAHAGDLQNWWHKVINAPPVNGWASELHNELGVNLNGEWRYRISTPPIHGWGGDLIGLGTVALGNVEVSAGAGAIGRVGFNLRDDFGPPRLRPGAAGTEFFEGHDLAVYVFGGAYARIIGHDIFLDGNNFEDSAFVQREDVVPEYTLGFAVRTPAWQVTDTTWWIPPVRFGYTWVRREHEFHGQNGPSEFGAFSITILANGLRLPRLSDVR